MVDETRDTKEETKRRVDSSEQNEPTGKSRRNQTTIGKQNRPQLLLSFQAYECSLFPFDNSFFSFGPLFSGCVQCSAKMISSLPSSPL